MNDQYVATEGGLQVSKEIEFLTSYFISAGALGVVLELGRLLWNTRCMLDTFAREVIDGSLWL